MYFNIILMYMCLAIVSLVYLCNPIECTVHIDYTLSADFRDASQ